MIATASVVATVVAAQAAATAGAAATPAAATVSEKYLEAVHTCERQPAHVVIPLHLAMPAHLAIQVRGSTHVSSSALFWREMRSICASLPSV